MSLCSIILYYINHLFLSLPSNMRLHYLTDYTTHTCQEFCNSVGWHLSMCSWNLGFKFPLLVVIIEFKINLFKKSHYSHLNIQITLSFTKIYLFKPTPLHQTKKDMWFQLMKRTQYFTQWTECWQGNEAGHDSPIWL